MRFAYQNMMPAFALGLAVCLVAEIPAFAEVPRDPIAEGIACHDRARRTPAGNVERGKELLAPHIAFVPLAKGYYGSLLTIEAGVANDAGEPLKAVTLLLDGAKLIDEAVSEAPDLIDLRYLRLIGSYEVSVSSPMNRFREMRADIDWFDARAERLGHKGLSTDERATVELYRALYLVKAKRLGEALDAFDLCVTLSPNSAEAAEARRQLSRYGE